MSFKKKLSWNIAEKRYFSLANTFKNVSATFSLHWTAAQDKIPFPCCTSQTVSMSVIFTNINMACSLSLPRFFHKAPNLICSEPLKVFSGRSWYQVLKTWEAKLCLWLLTVLWCHFLYTRYFFNYLQCFRVLTGAAWCRSTVISVGADSSTFLSQKTISFEHVVN